jgi:RimJ/RimL family protein N-acetyltransferase
MNQINLRKVDIKDEDLLFSWRNINELISLSLQKKKVTLTEHKKWFKNKIKNPYTYLRIVQADNKDVGLIRIELENNGCEVSIYLVPGNEGKGYGYRALAEALENVNFGQFFFANVQIDNLPSQKLFEKLDFIETSRDNKFILFKKIIIHD